MPVIVLERSYHQPHHQCIIPARGFEPKLVQPHSPLMGLSSWVPGGSSGTRRSEEMRVTTGLLLPLLAPLSLLGLAGARDVEVSGDGYGKHKYMNIDLLTNGLAVAEGDRRGGDFLLSPTWD